MGDRSSLLSRRTSFHLGRNRVSDWRGRGAIATSLVMVLGSIGWEQRINPKRAFAQITPDQTLGVTSSRVVASVGQTLIEGGLEQNGNLFHSFQQFNVPLTESVYFANPEGVTNILSRVTGDTPSNILGTLGVKGPANLFLLNPNGILFGPDARLDLGGAFVGSTASQINFDNNQAFSAVTPSTPSMLIISAPIGLQYGTGNPPGPIVVEGRLEVNPGETLTLAGGDIQITGVTGDRDSSSSLPDSSLPDLFLANTGQLIAPQGNISLLAINPSANRNRQTILFGNQFTINEESLPSSPQNSQFANISISRGAFIFAGNNNSVGDAGRIRIDGNNVSIGNNTRLSTRNSGRGDVGLIEINAIAQLDVSNQSTITNQASNRPKREGLLRGILLESTGGSVTVRESTLRTNVESDGTASRILITAADRILISQSTLSSQAQEEAGGGRIRLNAAEATIRDDSNINSGTSSQNQDTDAGKIILEISDQLVINHSQLRSGTDGLSNGDEIRIRAENADVRIINGGRLTSSTSGQGNAGSILVEAQNLWVEGFNAEGQEGDIFSGIFSRVRAEGQGDAQNINIDADTVDLVNGGRISTSVTEGGQGNAGTLTINSNQLNIVSFTTDGPSGRRSGIFARITSDAAGDGGNINLNLRDALQMRNGSRISTNVDAMGMDQTGGNINLTVRNGYVLATPDQSNTDITANALEGNGGQVTITTPGLLQLGRTRPRLTGSLLQQIGNNSEPNTLLRGIFGFTVRSRSQLSSLLNTNDPQQLNPWQLESNDITAVSQTNPELSGDIVFRTSDLDLSRDSIILPSTLVDVAGLLNVDVCQLSSRSRFVSVGQGGLPPTPYDLFTSDRLWQDQRLIYVGETGTERLETEAASQGDIQEDIQGETQRDRQAEGQAAPPHLIEAQGWVINDTGTVTLVAHSEMGTTPPRWRFAPTCD